jgi:hypothetical protein
MHWLDSEAREVQEDPEDLEVREAQRDLPDR